MDGQFFPDLDTHFEAFGDLVQIIFELVGGRGPVESGIVADGAKERLAVIEILAVLAQALARKCRLFVFALVDLSLPAFVGPGGSAETNQGRERHGEEV